jgi:hypothetical protein
VTRYVSVRLASVTGATGVAVEADATLENSPSVLFDGLILPEGAQALVKSGQAVEFLKDQFRHCKTILVMGGASALLEKAGIRFDAPDAGLILAKSGSDPNLYRCACQAPSRRAGPRSTNRLIDPDRSAAAFGVSGTLEIRPDALRVPCIRVRSRGWKRGVR